MANARKKISELTTLTSASLDTLVVGVDNGTTYKIELDVLADAVTSRVNILDRDRLSSLESVTSSFETKGRNLISSSAQISSLGFISNSVDISSLNSFTSSQTTLNTAFTNGINTRLQTSSFNEFSTSVDSRIIAATNEQSLTHLVNTSSFNQYTASISTASLVDRLNQIENVSGSWITESETGSFLTSLPNGILSGSVSYNDLINIPVGLVSESTDLTSLNQFTQSIDSRVDSLENATSSYLTSLNGALSSSSQLTSSFDTRYTLSGSVQPLPSNLISSSTQITSFGFVSGSYLTSLSGAISSSSELTSSFDTRYALSSSLSSISSSFNGRFNGLVTTGSNTFSGSQVFSGSMTVTSGQVIASTITNNSSSLYLTSGSNLYVQNNGIVEITGSIILNGTTYTSLTGSGTIPSGTVSGSSQLTSSYDSRYVLSGSVSAVPAGTISGSAQITAFGFVSSSTSIPVGTISGSSQLTSSYDGRYVQTGSFNTLTQSFNSFTASAQSVTTGSNSFNGTQTITGSLIITTGSFIGSQIVANTSSLYLTSGSNMYVQNNGIVEITGSLNVNGVTTFARIGGDEGGEFRFGIPATNTTLQDRVTVDIFQNRFRIFEGSANAKGVYIDLSAAADGAGTNILNLNYFLEAYASVTYSLPGSYTNDTCRYSVVNTNINVSSSWFDTSTYTFTPQKAGYWQITAGYDIYRGSSTAEASLFIQKNGSTVAIIGGLGMVMGVVTKIVYLNGSTDNIKIVNNGSAISSRSQSSDKSFFQAKFLSE